MTDPTALVAAVKATDDYLHVGTVATLLPHLGVVAGQPLPAGVAALEIYDGAGTRYGVDESGAAPALVAAAAEEAIDPGLLVDRIAVVLARAQVALDSAPNNEIGPRVPQLAGPLPVVLAALAAWIAPLPPAGAQPNSPNAGGPFHNWLHSVGLAHIV